MPFVKKTYRQIAKDILTQICGGETIEEHVYKKGKSIYRLVNTPVIDVNAVKGKSEGITQTFTRDVDYRVAEDSIEWGVGAKTPDDDTVFSVNCTFTRPSGITDVNPGSVVRTIVEAISRELENFYLQLEQAYFSGFLDTATVDALDLVVSIIGMKRKPPQPSSGSVTFGRNTEPETLTVANEVHLFDGSLEYSLTNSLVKDVSKIEGTYKGVEVEFERNKEYVLSGRIIKWLKEGSIPDKKTVFRVDYDAYREIRIPKGTSVATVSPTAEDIRFFTTTEEALLARTSGGKWEAELPVTCTVSGKTGNVLAGAVGVMPQPLSGVEYVVNKGNITNGVDAEGDDELRERARHALEFAGKATYSSLESAIKSVEGVRSLLVEDMPDNVAGLVNVVVDGGEMEKIQHMIDETRAAGIKVEVSRPEIVNIDVSLVLVLKKGVDPTIIAEDAEKQIRSYISTLGIGSDVLYSRIIESIVGIEGVWDAEDILLTAYRVDGSILQIENENVEISNEERAEPRNISLPFEERSKE